MIVRDDEKVKKTIAENIVRYRRECNLTQAELAEKIHYSDKSVSKWERADGVPDIFVLVMLAELFGVTVNDLLTEKHRKSHRAAPKLKRSIITLMSAGLVWLVAAVVFFAFKVAFPDLPRIWLAFIYAIPAMFIVTLVLSALWHRFSVICPFAESFGVLHFRLISRLTFRTFPSFISLQRFSRCSLHFGG